MFDHVGIKVTDLEKAARFYEAALRSLGHARCYAGSDVVGFGPNGQPALWLHAGAGPGTGAHVALRAADRAAVRAFHAAGLGHGGGDNGAPGLRPDYGPSYYAAFLLDPDGNNIEAVCLAEGL